MNILLTNDDGYFAKGLRELASALSKSHNVIVCAPSSECSGSAHMVHFFGGISFKKVETPDGVPTYSVDGTPSDCVIFAVRHLFKDVRFDAVISGINNVLNIGSDFIYSGTVGAAQEGTFQQIPSIAVSLRTKGSDDYSFASEFVANNLDKLLALAKGDVTLNVNIPSVKREDILGVKAAHIVFRPYDEAFVSRIEDGKEIFSIEGKPLPDALADKAGDCYLAKNGYITLTPVKLIPNDFDALARCRTAEDSLWR